MKKILNVTINGTPYEIAIKPKTTLVEVLRNELNLTGTKRSCNAGGCSSCSVLVDGKVVNSCSVLALQVDGKEVTTIEGIADGAKLHPLQQAFLEHGAYQCGYCTPGMIIAGKALLDENPNPTKQEVKEAIAGNLCRCTGYVRIVDAILATAKKLQEEAK
ncbi:MAG: (2Fe-2S)-binding protein [Deltaproteobacteria bacterium]|nr:(2Fe-2S)-binding protein [Deltaproteobacteria bacterium]RLA91031.1 MAG: (2Fe-2S)-binding protein [Deltaproteobacteria bacterium]